MKLCNCPTTTSTAVTDRLRCLRCAGWQPHGRLPNPDHITQVAAESISLLQQIASDYGWAHNVAHQPTRHPQNGTTASIGDPTGNAVADDARTASRAYSLIATRLIERALRDLKAADEAIGDALLAAEPPGPDDHVQAPFHDPATLYPGRPDLEQAHAAQARRCARGEGTP